MISKLLVEIDKAKDEAARAAVTGVTDPSLFEYGVKVGFYRGLEHIRVMIEKQLRDRDEADKYL